MELLEIVVSGAGMPGAMKCSSREVEGIGFFNTTSILGVLVCWCLSIFFNGLLQYYFKDNIKGDDSRNLSRLYMAW